MILSQIAGPVHSLTRPYKETLVSRNAGFIRQQDEPHGPLPDKSGVPVVLSRCASLRRRLGTALKAVPGVPKTSVNPANCGWLRTCFFPIRRRPVALLSHRRAPPVRRATLSEKAKDDRERAGRTSC